MARHAAIERSTRETKINMEINIDGGGNSHIFTSVGFFDHMLTQFAKHGFIDIYLNAEGDIDVDFHHTVEDVGIVLGKGLAQALGDKEGIVRYGYSILPMEDALVICAVDFSGRAYLAFDAKFTNERVGELETEMIEEFFRAVCLHAGLNMHIKLIAGKNNHHMAEAIFKAFGRAVAQAVARDPRIDGVMSTKGMLE
ncbi:MAG: imidazoleglycerol-phosphate dehydratase HisB [Clostridiales bacterium]|jgi:imidazoleglycerol-phosphate dehydratase|nr:imidazoleglycerol-phosphate dehydratase HisB [Clostridiales bacterium]